MSASSRPVTRARRIHAVSTILALVALLAVGTSPTSATVVDRFKFGGPYTYTNWDCGYPMAVAGVENHSVHVRADNKLPDVFYGTDNFDWSETWTATDGRSFRLSSNGVAKDKKGKHVGGSVYQFAFTITGQFLTLANSSGKVLYRDRGKFSFNYMVDLATGESTDLGVTLHGPHPIFEMGVCKLAGPLTGSESARYLTPRPIGSTTFPMGFYEYLPPSYGATGVKSPLLIALNGYGENGDGTAAGLRNLLNTGIPRFIDVGGWPTSRPLVVLALQHVENPLFGETSCDDVPWFGSCNMQIQHDINHSPAFCTTPYEVRDFIAYAVAHYNVDPHRVYITGLSCGAFGGWEYLGLAGPTQVAAAVLVAGDGRPAWGDSGCALGSAPIWAIHGELDDVVNPLGSSQPIDDLRTTCGVSDSKAKLTIYPGLYHDGWDQAYSGSLGDDIYSWMLGFTKP